MSPDPLELERARRAESDRRQRILSEVSRVLLDYAGPDEAEPLRRVVDKVTETLGDWCAFSLVQPGGKLVSVATFHPDPRQRELEKKLNVLVPPRQWDGGPPAVNALVQRKPLVFENITEEMLRASLPSKEAVEIFLQLRMTSALVAPMFDGQEPLGQLLLASTGAARRYDEGDIEFADALASRAALAVRNARLMRDLQRRAAELSAVFNSDPNGIALFDSDGILKLASPRTEEIFGLPLSTMVGQPWQQIYRRKLDQAVSNNREQLFGRIAQLFGDPNASGVDELELERPHHRWVNRTTVPVRGPDGAYLGRLVVYSDVTEQRDLDRQRSDFLTVAAHELRTPLTPLSMYLQSIERRLQNGQAVDPELASKARRQVDRLGKLVEGLLDVSRIESRRLQMARELFDLNDLAGQVVADFSAAAKLHEIVFHRLPEPVLVQGDRQRLEQVLVNLLQNALKYSPHGGQVAVRVDRSGGEARTSVTDRGIGIPREEQERLFQRFFRAANATTRNYGGLGIGLFVSREIVDRHGGRFEVQSAPGVGSTFTFFLPVAPGQDASQGRARVLVVDDDPEILEATGQVLREWGYAVDEARDGATALSLARGTRPDLMLVDLMMPVMDGWTLIRRMREERVAERVPLVIVSADRDTREKARALAADASLRKPFELQELQDVMERLLPQKPAA